MLFILRLSMIKLPLEALVAGSGCHRGMSHTSDPVLDRESAWQENKTAAAKEY
jgi:hypothetical protein